jgi:hypothetical protein
MAKFIGSVFSSSDKDEANDVMHAQARLLTNMGRGKSHGVKVVKRSGAYQVEVYEK